MKIIENYHLNISFALNRFLGSTEDTYIPKVKGEGKFPFTKSQFAYKNFQRHREFSFSKQLKCIDLILFYLKF